MARFFNHMISENVQVFWAELQRGEFITDAAEVAGTYRKQGTRWVIANGGVRPRRGRNLKGRCLTFAEREEIAVSRAAGEWMRSIAARLGRSPSTISREPRNAERVGSQPRESADAEKRPLTLTVKINTCARSSARPVDRRRPTEAPAHRLLAS